MNHPRILLVATFAFFGGLASADRLIFLPIGKKVPFRGAKLQHLFDGADNDRSITTLGLGVGMSFEIEVSYDRRFEGQTDQSIDVSYNFSDPVINYGPGISVGMRDLSNQTEEGRYGYLVFTFQEGLDGELNQDSPAEGSFGLKYGRKGTNFYFAGYMPYSTQLAILAELESTGSMTAGLEYKPTPGAEIRWLHRSNQILWSVGYVKRF